MQLNLSHCLHNSHLTSDKKFSLSSDRSCYTLNLCLWACSFQTYRIGQHDSVSYWIYADVKMFSLEWIEKKGQESGQSRNARNPPLLIGTICRSCTLITCTSEFDLPETKGVPPGRSKPPWSNIYISRFKEKRHLEMSPWTSSNLFHPVGGH